MTLVTKIIKPSNFQLAKQEILCDIELSRYISCLDQKDIAAGILGRKDNCILKQASLICLIHISYLEERSSFFELDLVHEKMLLCLIFNRYLNQDATIE